MTGYAPHSTRAQLALSRLPETDPAIAALSLWCLHRDSDAPTRTEGETIRYGPEFPLLPLAEQVGLLAHHVLHVAFRHSSRRTALKLRIGAMFQSDLYDLACDALVNETLLQAGHALPRPAVRASELITRLPAEERPDDVLADWDSDRLYFAIASGPAAAGEKRRAQIRDYAAAQCFQPDLGESAPDTADPEVWSARIEQALSAGRNAGVGIGAAQFRFGDLPVSEIPWETRLRRVIHKALSPHPLASYLRPTRAWLARDAEARRAGLPTPAYEPGVRRDLRRPRLVVCLDTSSSITETELHLFAAEAIALVRRAGGEAHVLGFDTVVHHRARLTRAEMIGGLEMRRGGGTDFGDVMVEAQRLDPSLIVVFTDLGADPGDGPAAQVVWVVPDPPQPAPPYGDVVVMRR